MKPGLALVVGKFLPPHRGHSLLIATAVAQSVRTVVALCAKPGDFVPGETRARWLRELHPTVEVIVVDDRHDEQDLQAWAQNTLRWLGRAPDAVFSSEDYGERYASLLGARHILVDRERVRVPVSATAIRRDPYAHWDFLEAPARGWLAKRVCVIGAESTGKTTLTQALAEHFRTGWVAEYGREYSLAKQAKGEREWSSQEFAQIAAEQSRREDAAAREANRVLFCDTNALATGLWHRRHVGRESGEVAAIARGRRYDLYLLAGDEIPFVADGLRDGEHVRHEMHGWFEETLAAQPVPWLVVRGSPGERLGKAIEATMSLFSPV